MKKIGILADTHGMLDERIFNHFENVDEIWHAGDIGSREVLDAMQADLLTKGRAMAYELTDVASVGPVLLNRLREQAGVHTLQLLTGSGHLVANSSGDLQGLLPALPDSARLRQARLGSGTARVEGDAAGHLYLVALHRYLRFRLKDAYSYDTHVGGAFYLFVRGMQGADDGRGVYFHRPEAAIIEGISDALDPRPWRSGRLS